MISPWVPNPAETRPPGAETAAGKANTFSHPVAADLVILAGFTVAFLAATCAVIVRKTAALS